MDLINLLLVPLVSITAYYAFASAHAYARSHKWMKTLYATTAGGLLAGCAFHADGSALNARMPQEQREFNLQAAWSGRSYEALVQAFGPPELIMDVPGFRQLRTSAVLYGVRDSASQCIDAFTVVVDSRTGEHIVTNYFCR